MRLCRILVALCACIVSSASAPLDRSYQGDADTIPNWWNPLCRSFIAYAADEMDDYDDAYYSDQDMGWPGFAADEMDDYDDGYYSDQEIEWPGFTAYAVDEIDGYYSDQEIEWTGFIAYAADEMEGYFLDREINSAPHGSKLALVADE